MNIYIYIYINKYIYTSKYIYKYTQIRMNICMDIYTHIHIQVTCIPKPDLIEAATVNVLYICVYIYVYTYIYIHIYIYICTYIYVYIHIYIQTHMYT
jgi:hypothetical protein